MSKIAPNIIEQILPNYFIPEEIAEYKKIIASREIHLPPTKKGYAFSDKEQLSSNLLYAKDYSSYIDLLITFSEVKLEKLKYIQLLMYLGETSIAQGELQTASQLYLHVLSTVKQQKEYENVSAHSLLSLGDIASRQALWSKSINFLKQARNLFNKQKDLKGAAKCSNILGTIYGDRGDLNKAKFHFNASLELLNPKTDSLLIGMLELNLGIVNNIQGEYDEALSYYQRALIKYEQINDVRRITELRHNLGMLYTQKEDHERAIKEFDKSINVALKVGYLPTLALSYLSKAFIYTHKNDYNLAASFADKSMEISYSLNDRLTIADIYKVKGIIERNVKNFELAESYFLTSIRINIELENLLNIAESSFELAQLYKIMKRYSDAKTKFEEAKSNYKKLKANSFVKKIEKELVALPS